MGNKLVVDKNCSDLSDILIYNTSELPYDKTEDINDNINTANDSNNFHLNLKIWKIFEDENDIVTTSPVNITTIKEEHFLFHSEEAYIILLVYKGNDEIYELSAFPNSLWGIVESSSNMTPRGLQHVFSSSSATNSESLESYILSKREFKDSEYKFVLFIWNGKNTSALVKSTVLMKAFDLDKKFSNPTLLPFLYSGYYIDKNKFEKGEYILLNEIITNTFEGIVSDDNNSSPSTETFLNFHETVYLLHWLYPIKESIMEKKKSDSKKNVCFPKFNSMFLKPNRDYYDCFVDIEKKEKLSRDHDKVDLEENISNQTESKENDVKFNLKFDNKKENEFRPIIKKIEIPSFKLIMQPKILNEGK